MYYGVAAEDLLKEKCLKNVFNIEIPRSVRATECPGIGESIFTHDPNGKVAEAYANLAKEVIGLERETKVKPRPYSVR